LALANRPGIWGSSWRWER